MNLSQRMKDLIQQVLADAEHDDADIRVEMDEFGNVYASFDDVAGLQRYVPVADLELFFQRYDDMRGDHATDADCFWDIMNEHYQE